MIGEINIILTDVSHNSVWNDRDIFKIIYVCLVCEQYYSYVEIYYINIVLEWHKCIHLFHLLFYINLKMFK